MLVLTYSKSQAKCNVADCVDPSVDCRMPNVDYVSQLRHHTRINHPYAEPKSAHGNYQMVDSSSKRHLKFMQQTRIIIDVNTKM